MAKELQEKRHKPQPIKRVRIHTGKWKDETFLVFLPLKIG
jgi:hypothetical protein